MSFYNSKVCLVVDNGLFVELAVELSRSFGTVLYYSPWVTAFPTSNARLVGVGVEGIQRVYDLHSVLDQVDLFVFPDVYWAGLQVYLESQGKRVFGSREAEILELNREFAHQTLPTMGIPVPEWTAVVGLDALREHLREHPDVWVKLSTTRGDFETFRVENYDLVEPFLDELEHKLGAKKKIVTFIVEENIPNATEWGCDSVSIDGRFPEDVILGVEAKDKAYLGKLVPYASIPVPLREVNSKLEGFLQGHRYRNFLSVETRIVSDDEYYVIDPCCRFGSPPTEALLPLIENWADIVWYGAEGELVEPVYRASWVAEIMLHSAWADKNWQPIQILPEIRDQVRLRNLTVIDGTYYVVPQGYGLPEIGAVVGLGNTADEAISDAMRVADLVKGFYIDTFKESFTEALETFGSAGLRD
jgi:hypothetical protein